MNKDVSFLNVNTKYMRLIAWTTKKIGENWVLLQQYVDQYVFGDFESFIFVEFADSMFQLKF